MYVWCVCVHIDRSVCTLYEFGVVCIFVLGVCFVGALWALWVLCVCVCFVRAFFQGSFSHCVWKDPSRWGKRSNIIFASQPHKKHKGPSQADDRHHCHIRPNMTPPAPSPAPAPTPDWLPTLAPSSVEAFDKQHANVVLVSPKYFVSTHSNMLLLLLTS